MEGKVKIEKLSEAEIADKGCKSWPIWTKKTSSFDWSYSDNEQCLVTKGKVTIQAEGNEYNFAAGDFVTFQKGLSCKWVIHEDVEKHYNFY